MKKILSVLFMLAVLVGCSSVEYSTTNLILETGISEDEFISEVRDTIKSNGEKATEEQLEDIDITFDKSIFQMLAEFEIIINVDGQKLTSKVSFEDTTKPIIQANDLVEVEYNTDIDKAKLIELLNIELSDNHASEDKLLENLTFSSYNKESSGKQEITLTVKDENENETNKIVIVKVKEKPAPQSKTPVISYATSSNTDSSSNYYEPQSVTVWLSATGTKYHSINNCGRMNPNRARQVTLSQAQASGYGRCLKCW